ncbi:MAG: T9SS type A sorting domain-containing protein, partial [Bernardetiaceae bacterium]|nr:T9SS type A sorting domain-containing protein [Bernardetiaceae bacterium]
KTAWERDNDYFEVEKSRDGERFHVIGRVASKGVDGNSNGVLEYVHYDERPWLGKNYYRLKQVDKDGSVSYSKIAVVVFERERLEAGSERMEVYPNPWEESRHSLKVVLPAGGVGEGWLVMWDVVGRQVHRQRIEEGTTQLEILPQQVVGKLAAGAYVISAIGRQKTFTAKVVVE